MNTVRVDASKSYDIVVGEGLLTSVGERVRQVSRGDIAALITDDQVDALYGAAVANSLRGSGFRVEKFVISHGEASKNAENYIRILNFLAEKGLTRQDTVVALGGGVVGDMAGFAAATFMRGIGFVQVPTTLLAAVDSSVGGKTAIDLETGKNLVGAFYQPDAVICDYETLKTLPAEIFADGCAEVIKYGMIWDSDLFEQLNNPMEGQLESIISRCVSIKRDVVNEDERDTGLRQILNFGHTFGHAVEKSSKFSISHGSAVAIGMAMVTRASAKMGLCDPACAGELCRMLERYRLPQTSPFGAEILEKAVLADKKRTGDTISLILPRAIGKCEIRKTPVKEVGEFIRAGLD